MARVDICVCTFRRPFLAETLRSIGRLAVKLSSAADRCIQVLLQLVASRVSYVVQEVMVVVKVHCS